MFYLLNLSQAVALAASAAVAPGDEAAAGVGVEPETEGACGWSKPQTSLELTCGGQTEVRGQILFLYHLRIISLSSYH